MFDDVDFDSIEETITELEETIETLDKSIAHLSDKRDELAGDLERLRDAKDYVGYEEEEEFIDFISSSDIFDDLDF